jgi:hypothetical protein
MFLMIAGAAYLGLGLTVVLGMTRAAQHSDIALEIQEAAMKSRASEAAAPPAASAGAAALPA